MAEVDSINVALMLAPAMEAVVWGRGLPGSGLCCCDAIDATIGVGVGVACAIPYPC